MNKKKTATVTWITYRNFGTFLQAYALQKVIIMLGYENTILSDKNIIESFRNPSVIYSILSRIKRFVLSLKKQPIGILDSKYCYDRFAKQFMKIDYDWKNQEELNDRYDTFLCGSDQIWSPNVPFHSYYYLEFTDKKKIAYAPSMGSFNYPENKISIIKPYLEKFSFLSVREVQGEKIIKEKFNLNCQTVIDPTLLLERTDWENLITKDSDKEYVLCYLLTYNKKYLQYVRKFADTKGYELRVFITDPRYIKFADIPLYVGPLEFLSEIRNSTYFFTDSFHGSVFGILFERDFYTFKRFKDGAKNNQNSRVLNLFEKLNLLDRFLSEEELNSVENLVLIDYPLVRERLKLEREKSLSFLKGALSE